MNLRGYNFPLLAANDLLPYLSRLTCTRRVKAAPTR